MTYFEDLTGYAYCGTRSTFKNTLNIGWLDPSQSFVKGKTSKLFASRLLRFCSVFVNAMRGLHGCGYCKHRHAPITAEFEGHALRLGFAEIRVFHRQKVYAAPNLIYHYVVEHGYKPPREFVEAVLNGPQPTEAEYFQLLKDTGLSYFLPNDEEKTRLADEYRNRMSTVISNVMEKQTTMKKRAPRRRLN